MGSVSSNGVFITTEQLIRKHKDKHGRCVFASEVLRETVAIAGLLGENWTPDLLLANISIIYSIRYSVILIYCTNKITL